MFIPFSNVYHEASNVSPKIQIISRTKKTGNAQFKKRKSGLKQNMFLRLRGWSF